MLNFISSSAPSLDDQPPIANLPLPDIEQGGQAINLIVAVRDHAPTRIKDIQKSVQEMQAKIAELQIEERLLTQLLEVVSQP